MRRRHPPPPPRLLCSLLRDRLAAAVAAAIAHALPSRAPLLISARPTGTATSTATATRRAGAACIVGTLACVSRASRGFWTRSTTIAMTTAHAPHDAAAMEHALHHPPSRSARQLAPFRVPAIPLRSDTTTTPSDPAHDYERWCVSHGGATATTAAAHHLFSFGVITDVQTADVQYGYSHDKTEKRFYRDAVGAVHRAVRAWDSYDRSCYAAENDATTTAQSSPPLPRTGIEFVMHLGDLLDGLDRKQYGRSLLASVMKALEGRDMQNEPRNHDEPAHASLRTDETDAPWRQRRQRWQRRQEERASPYDAVDLDVDDEDTRQYPGFPVYHTIGNHDFYNMDRQACIRLFRMTSLVRRSYNIELCELPADAHTIPCMFGSVLARANASSSSSSSSSAPRLANPIALYDVAYYEFSPHPLVRVIVLDSFDVGVLGRSSSHPHCVAAHDMLNRRNPNPQKNAPDGLVGLDRRFVAFNGGIGHAQLLWLDMVLAECDRLGQRAIIVSHVPFQPGASNPIAMCWNYEDVLFVLQRHSSPALCLHGHDHKGGRAHIVNGAAAEADENDAGGEQEEDASTTTTTTTTMAHGSGNLVIPVVTLPGIVTTPTGRDCFGRIDVFSNAIVLAGVDLMPSLAWEVPSSAATSAATSAAVSAASTA